MPESVIDMKSNVAHYKELIKEKEKLEKEYSSWVELTHEMHTVLAKVKAVYDVGKTEEAKEELDKWLKEEKDYLEIIDEYAEKFKEINAELDSLDTALLEEQGEYLANLTRFQEISDKMKEIEKRSKKIAGGATIGTNCIKIENAEGRNKNIHIYFADVYRALSEEKRALAKVIRKQYNKLFNEEVVVKKETFIPHPPVGTVWDPTTPLHNQALTDVEGNVEPEKETEEINIDEENKEKSKEEKIAELKARMEELRKASGRKQRIKCYGEVVELPRINVGKYLMCASELNKLTKEIEEKEKAAALESPFVTEAPVTPIININNRPSIDIPLDDTPVIQPEGNMDPNDLSSPFIADAKVTPVANNNIYSSEEMAERYNIDIPLDGEVPTIPTEEQFNKDDDELIAMINKHYNEIVAKKEKEKLESKEKPKGFLRILNIKKPKDKEKLKDKIKKALLVIAATVVVAVLVSPVISNMVKRSTSNNPDLGTTTSTTMQDDKFKEEKPTIIIQPEVEEKASLKLGEKLYVSENASIFNTVNDAANSVNAKNPLFDYNLDRSVGGIAVNYEGKLYFFYATDANAQENIDLLLQNGGEITAVLASNEMGYEGFYNISDVQNLNQNLGGTSR